MISFNPITGDGVRLIYITPCTRASVRKKSFSGDSGQIRVASKNRARLTNKPEAKTVRRPEERGRYALSYALKL